MLIFQLFVARFMSNNTSIITLPNESLHGVVIWILSLLTVLLVSVLLFEVLRNKSKFSKVYYTRLEAKSTPTIPHPSNHFGWIKSVFRTNESVVLKDVGLDAVMYLRYLSMCFVLFGILSVIMFTVLIPGTTALTS